MDHLRAAQQSILPGNRLVRMERDVQLLDLGAGRPAQATAALSAAGSGGKQGSSKALYPEHLCLLEIV